MYDTYSIVKFKCFKLKALLELEIKTTALITIYRQTMQKKYGVDN